MAQAGIQSPLPSKWNQEKYLLENSSRDSLCWLEDEQNNYLPSLPNKIISEDDVMALTGFQPPLPFQAKLFQTRENISDVKVIVIIVILLSSSDEFSVATPDETTGKATEFSLVGCFRNK